MVDSVGRDGEAPAVSFGHEVRRRRRAAKLTLEALAARAGLSANYLGTVERGSRDPSLSCVQAIADALGVTVGDLVGGKGQPSGAATEAARLFEQAPEDVQEATLALLRAVVRRRRS
jgi:transcriptional regulator with XRE-family HTH domain